MKRLVSIFLVLLMLMGFSACERGIFEHDIFAPRSDSVYIKVYNNTDRAIKSFALDEYENFVLKSTIVAQNADRSSYASGTDLIFEVLGAAPDSLSFTVSATDARGKEYTSKTVSAAVLNRGIVYAYSVKIAGDRLTLEPLGVEE